MHLRHMWPQGPVCIFFTLFVVGLVRNHHSLDTYVYNTNTHTHTFNAPLSRTTWVSRYQKGKTSLDFTGARDSEWQWHQLDHMLQHLAPDR